MSFEDQLKNKDILTDDVMRELSFFASRAANHFKSECIEAAKKGATFFSQNACDVDNIYYSYPLNMNLCQPLRFYFDSNCTKACNGIGHYGAFESSYDEKFIDLLKSQLIKLEFQNFKISKHYLYVTKQIQKKNRIKSFFKDKEIYDYNIEIIGNITVFEIFTTWN